MRLATYNIEWFHRLFDDDGRLLEDDRWSARYNITRAQQSLAIATILRRMDADGVMVIEAPDAHAGRDGIAALENFAARHKLRTRRAIMGFVNDTKQEIAFLYDPDVVTPRHDPRQSRAAPRFDQTHTGENGPVRWSKPPLELELEFADRRLRVIGVHAKSKAAHGARDAAERAALGIANRRKQLAQCAWLRARIDEHLRDGDSLIVMGDFNDGPGLDEYEKLFGNSGIELVLGEGAGALFEPHAQMAMMARFGTRPTTARFYIPDYKRYFQALLDYIMVSSDLHEQGKWRIWHPFDDPECWEDLQLRDALVTASDHFPVSFDF